MADLHKYTSKEVLNKVLLTSGGSSVAAFSHTTAEALNAALDASNNRLNVSLSGGTISGDVTISGDLTVSGSSTYTYDESVDGQMWVWDSGASGATAGGHLRLFSDDGAVMASGHRLGVIEFAGAEAAESTSGARDATKTIGARIEAITDATWSASENGADLVFYTTDGNASETEAMRMTAESNVELLSGRFQVKHAGTDTGLSGSGMEIHGGSNPVLLSYNRGGSAYLPMVFDALNYSVKVSNTARMVIDSNSRISMSNNDSGSGGLDSTSGNTTMGYLSGNAITTNGHDNTLYGHGAGKLLTTGDDNCAFGAGALAGSQDGEGNTAIGFESLAIYEGGPTEGKNTALGFKSSRGLQTGQSNTSVGYNSAALMTTGDGNVAIGALTLGAAVSAECFNVALGYNSMGAADEGTGNIDNNIAIGFEALNLKADVNANLYNNIAIGYQALYDPNYVGSGMVAIGKNSCKELEDGDANTAVGKDTLKVLTSGDNNTAFGTSAGDVITTGSNNTCIGKSADTSANNASNQTVIGSGVTGVGNNSVTLGNADVDAVYMASDSGATVHAEKYFAGVSSTSTAGAMHIKGPEGGTGVVDIECALTSGTRGMIAFHDDDDTLVGSISSNLSANTTAYGTSSDYRLKENVVDMSDGLSRINQLKPKKFNMISDPDSTIMDGFLAHEVSDIVPEAIYGEKDAVNEDGKIKPQQIDMSKLVPILVKAVQELSAKVAALEAK